MACHADPLPHTEQLAAALLAQASFPVVESLLRDFFRLEQLTRYRIHMSVSKPGHTGAAPGAALVCRVSNTAMQVCTVFCFLGMAVLLANGKNINGYQPPSSQAEPAESTRSCRVDYSSFGVVAVVLAIRSVALTGQNVLWPMYLKDTFGWDAEKYSYVLLANTVVGVGAMAVFPAIEKLLGGAGGQRGRIRTALVCSTIAALSSVIAFHWSNRTGFCVLNNVLFGLLLHSTLLLLEPSLKAIASFYVTEIGRAFGVLGLVAGVGEQVGLFMY